MTEGLSELQRALGYEFHDRGILLQALTHTSYGHEHFPKKSVANRDNERLEFLGDAILDGIISDILLEAFPQANEGQLSKLRAAAVNEKTLAELAKQITLDGSVRLGKGELQTGGNLKPSILSSTFEALIAAIYIDGGFNAVYPVVRHLFAPLFRDQKHAMIQIDHKTQLQERIQAEFKVTPTYHLVLADGPDHAKTFEVEVRMNGKSLGSARGSSKKEAEQNAARYALERPESRTALMSPDAQA